LIPFRRGGEHAGFVDHGCSSHRRFLSPGSERENRQGDADDNDVAHERSRWMRDDYRRIGEFGPQTTVRASVKFS
jgi:hypothetical protein